MSIEPSPARQGGRCVSTIAEFCNDHHISRSMLYKLWSVNKGPKFFNVGSKVLISDQAAADWRRTLEAETDATATATDSA